MEALDPQFVEEDLKLCFQMDSCSSLEKLNIKTRKPYTITKQRERWTEAEHNSFLEALKLYGRAWQRIEEHIGSKTAVQIRSHAQKFFRKLEKEAVAKGVPIAQALDIEIPPPRPKRKPNYPYPRNTHTRYLEKTSHTKNLENEKASVENEDSIPNESCITIETRKQGDIKHTNIKPVNLRNDTQTFPRQVPVQVVDLHQEVSAKTSDTIQMSFHESRDNKLGLNPPNPFLNIATAKFYHPANTETSSADSFSRDQLSLETNPSMAAIAAATVAAATAWWSAHGLLPACTPFFPGGYSRNNGTEKAPLEEKKDAYVSYSSDEPDKKLNSPETASVVDVNDSSKTNVGKQIDRSFCGSNTNCSSEKTEMNGLEKEESKGSDVKESISLSGKISISQNGSRKEVSKEARLSFQSLFSRQALPQSFSDNPTVAEKDQHSINKKTESELNKTIQKSGKSNNNGNGFVMRMGLKNMKVNNSHSGFRPYKKCSIEAKESGKIVSVGNKNDEKRMCLGTEASA